MYIKKAVLLGSTVLTLNSCGWVWDTIHSRDSKLAEQETSQESQLSEENSQPNLPNVPQDPVVDNSPNVPQDPVVDNSPNVPQDPVVDNSTAPTNNGQTNVSDSSTSVDGNQNLTDTGSTEPFKETIPPLAQIPGARYHRGPMHQWTPVIIMFQGENSLDNLKLEINEPPSDITACHRAVILGEGIPIVDKKYQYKSWWLIATNTSYQNQKQDDSVYFYWAKQISKTEVGVIPADFKTTEINSTHPQNLKIDTGYIQLPYQWVSRLEWYQEFPKIEEEKCVG